MSCKLIVGNYDYVGIMFYGYPEYATEFDVIALGSLFNKEDEPSSLIPTNTLYNAFMDL